MIVALAIGAARQPGTSRTVRPIVTSVATLLTLIVVFGGIAAGGIYVQREQREDRVLRVLV
jgi:hypothetical protein